MVQQLIKQLHGASDEIDRASAAASLRSFENKDTILALVQALGDQDAIVVGAAMDTLRGFQPENVLPYLITRSRHMNEPLRWSIAELLAEFPSPEAEEALRRSLNDISPNVQSAAARSLAAMKLEHQTIEKLLELLEHPDPFPRYEALNVLESKVPHRINVVEIVARDLYSPEPQNRLAALWYVRKSGELNWIPYVKQLISDPEPSVRKTAEWVLTRLRTH